MYLVITATGADRVGIADELAEQILSYECNIEESKMAVLGGEFAVLLLVSGEAARIKRLSAEVATVAEATGLEMSARPTSAHQDQSRGMPYLIESVSLDTPGIVHAVTAVLRRNGVNIEDLETETSGAPFTGAPMFHMRIRAIVPPEVPIRRLRTELDTAADEHDLDVRIEPVLPAAGD